MLPAERASELRNVCSGDTRPYCTRAYCTAPRTTTPVAPSASHERESRRVTPLGLGSGGPLGISGRPLREHRVDRVRARFDWLSVEIDIFRLLYYVLSIMLYVVLIRQHPVALYGCTAYLYVPHSTQYGPSAASRRVRDDSARGTPTATPHPHGHGYSSRALHNYIHASWINPGHEQCGCDL